MDKMLKFYVKVFESDEQGDVRQAILYADRSCFSSPVQLYRNIQQELLHYWRQHWDQW